VVADAATLRQACASCCADAIAGAGRSRRARLLHGARARARELAELKAPWAEVGWTSCRRPRRGVAGSRSRRKLQRRYYRWLQQLRDWAEGDALALD
jgi:hypothetical protein